MRRLARNITGRNVTPSGTRLNSGLDTITTFDLVTKAPMQLSENIRIRFTGAQSSSNDYFSSEAHISQFSVSAGAVLADGVSYSNKLVPRHSQFIAPYEGHVKSIQGYMVCAGSGSCAQENITISAWSKSVDSGGVAATAMNLIFTQELAFTSTGNEFVLNVDSTSLGTYNKLIMNEGEGVIFSIKRASGRPCVNASGSLTMVFESTDTQGTTEEFMFPSLSQANGRIDETISSPDASYVNRGTTATKVSD